MATNVIFDGLNKYLKENQTGLLRKAMLGAKTAQLFNLQVGIKTQAALNLLDVDVQFGDGNVCGFEAKGTDKVSQRVLKTGLIKVNKAWCDKDFREYFMQDQVRTAAGQKSLPFEQDFLEGISEKIAEAVEKSIWQGDVDSSTNNLKYFDGMLKILKAESEVIKPVIASGTSVYDAVMKVYMAIPEEVLANAVIFVGADTYRQFVADLVNKNLYHYSAGDNTNAELEMFIPSTTVKLIAVNGLNGTKAIVAGEPKNLNYGCDLVDDMEKYVLKFDDSSEQTRFVCEFNVGTQVAYPSEVVMAELK